MKRIYPRDARDAVRPLYPSALILLTVLTLLSLMLNGMVILGLLRARRIALSAVSEAHAFVTDISDDTFSYTIKVDQGIPVATSIPFNEEITVPINTTIPISTTVVVPIDLGVTSYELAVPINTVFPIDLEVAVPVSQTVDIVTTVPLDVDVPVEIALADTPLVGYLEELDAALAKMEARLEHPLGGGD